MTAAARFRPTTARLLAAALAGGLVATPSYAATVTVSDFGDRGANTLRAAVQNAAPGDTINFNGSGTVTLDNQITIDKNLTIAAGGGNVVTIRGNASSATRLFFVGLENTNPAVTLDGVTLDNGRARGGNGGAGQNGGGGGLGAGGAVFARSGDLTLRNVTLTNNAATGGNGGTGSNAPSQGGGGGGGLGGNGGASAQAGGGGGGFDPRGDGAAAASTGGNGGRDAAGNGGAGGQPFGTTATDGAGGGGGNPGGGSGANGGFGGGGGGSANGGRPGNGGFGGGGGGRGAGTPAGATAGFGGGAGSTGTPGFGGGTGTGANFPGFGGIGGSGGGGAGFGAAVFVAESATLTLQNTTATTASGNTVSAGTGGLGAGSGRAAGELIFTQGASRRLTVDVASGVNQTLDASGFADESAIGGGNVADLRKIGAGTLTLTESAGFGGGLIVNAGRLAVNGDLSGRTAGINAGAVLGGTGTVGNVTSTGGRIAPGNSVGTLNVAGSLTLDSASVTEIEFDSTGIDKIDATGDIAVDGTLRLVEIGAGVTLDTPLTFLEAGGDLTGSFDTTERAFLSGTRLVGATVNLDPAADRATVTFAGIRDRFRPAGRTAGGRAAGAALDLAAALQPAATLNTVNALLAAPNLGDAVESSSNVIASSDAAEVPAFMDLVSGAARRRVGGLSVARAGVSARLAAADPAAGDTVTDVNADPAAYTLPEAHDAGPIAWVQGVGGTSSIDGDDTAAGSDANTYGVSVGLEWLHPEGDATVGMFFGYTDTDTDLDGIADSSDTENFQAGVYASRRFDRHWHANATASASFLQFETSRAGGSEGDFDGFAAHATAELLYDVELDDTFILSPFVGGEYSFVKRDGYTESGGGALNLTVNDASSDYLSSLVGVQLAAAFTTDDGTGRGLTVRPSVRAAWLHQYLDDSAGTTSAFTAAPTTAFTTEGPARDRDGLRVGAGLEVGPAAGNRWNLYANYTADLTGDAEDHVVQAGIRSAF